MDSRSAIQWKCSCDGRAFEGFGARTFSMLGGDSFMLSCSQPVEIVSVLFKEHFAVPAEKEKIAPGTGFLSPDNAAYEPQ
ncbi:MAG: hypothetical protein ACYS9T_06790 [Planctomycetota bacterium]|jgi:hypothetical protein